jgi:Agrobacterium tumefaciens protein Atu4866
VNAVTRRRFLGLTGVTTAGALAVVACASTNHDIRSTTMTVPAQPFAFTDATVHVTPTRSVRGDIWVADGKITRSGPADGPRPTNARIIDASGAAIVPLMVDTAVRARPAGERGINDLVEGNSATFAVTRSRVGESQIRGALMINPDDLVAVVIAGKLMAWQGAPTSAAAAEQGSPTWVGAWIDDANAMEQHLLENGRYTETRSGRIDAYTGRYWTHGKHIAYLDDTGFWAFGEQYEDVLYHAHFVLKR